MTIIASYIAASDIYMACDSQATDRYDLDHFKTSKIIRIGDELLIGMAGAPRVAQILQYHLNLPELTASTKDDPERYIAAHVVPAMRQELGNHGSMFNEKGVDCVNLDALIAYRGRVFMLDGSFHVSESQFRYNAIGSGRFLALGAMHALDAMRADLDYALIVRAAVEAACQHNAGCGGPIRIFKSGEEVKESAA